VKKTWDQVAGVSSGGNVALVDQRIQLHGDTAIETGVEKGSFKIAGQPVDVEGRVTNVYRREGDSWKIVHHHADIAPAIVAVLSKLK
jgi:ketosteroid isomerase-like protein